MNALFLVIRRLEEWILSWGIFVIAAVTIANVFSRTLFGESLTFAEELSQFFVILVTFLGVSHAAGRGRHIRMSAIYDQLPTRARKALMVTISGLTAALMFLMAWYGARYVQSVYVSGTVSPALRLPLFWVYASAPLGFALAGVQYLLTVVRNLLEEGVYLSWDQPDEYEELPLP